MQCSRSCWLAVDLPGRVTVTTWYRGSDRSKVSITLGEDYLACFWRCTITTGGPLQLLVSVSHTAGSLGSHDGVCNWRRIAPGFTADVRP